MKLNSSNIIAPLSLAALALAAPLLHAQATTAPTTQALIQQLSADVWTDRQAAQKQLIDLGDAARGPVRQALDVATSEETRVRAQAVLAALDEKRAIGPSIITIHMKDAAPRDIFAELERQCGAPLEVSDPRFWDRPPANRRVSVDVERQPFWDAMDTISAATGVQIARSSGATFRVVTGMSEEGRAVNDGATRIVARSASFTRNISFGGGAAPRSNFNIQFTAAAEPRMHVHRSGGPPMLTEAVDDLGNSLLIPNTQQSYYYGGQTGNLWSFAAQLNYPEHPGKRIAKLRGSIDYLIRVKSETLEIPDIATARNVSKTVGPLTVTVTGMEQKEDQYELKVTLSTAQPDPLGMPTSQLYMYLQELQLLDARGNPLTPQGIGSSGSNQQIEGTVRFSRAGSARDGKPFGEPAKLVWSIATETRPITANFEFTDLPMP
jgi:hypothetical protein